MDNFQQLRCASLVKEEKERFGSSAPGSALLPEKSLTIYENTLEKFMKWRNTNNYQSFSEKVILLYLSELSTKVQSSTLWSHYSMLKSTLSVKYNVEIDNYPKVRAFLKRKNEGHVPRRSRVLEKEDILKFLTEAPDEQFLLTKVILLLGIVGALRRDELYKLKVNDIEMFGRILVVSVNDTKTETSRRFAVTEHLDIYQKYVALRPKNCTEDNFFINYQRGKCTRQVIGINKIGKVPSVVAKYLKLPNPKEFTGHSLRRSSVSLLDKNGDLLALRKPSEPSSSSIAQVNVKEDFYKKIERSKLLETETPPHFKQQEDTVYECDNKIDLIKQEVEDYNALPHGSFDHQNIKSVIFDAVPEDPLKPDCSYLYDGFSLSDSSSTLVVKSESDESEFDLEGRQYAEDLKSLLPEQRNLVRKLLAKIIYQAKMNMLSSD